MKDNEIKELLKQDLSEPKESGQTWSRIYSEISSEHPTKQSWLNRFRLYTIPSGIVAVLVLAIFINRPMDNDSSLISEEQELLAEYLFEEVGFQEDEITFLDEILS